MTAIKKQLLLMRHAKSDWNTPWLSDHDRPLNERGNRTAPEMGKFLAEQNLTPDFILSSSATRAMQTARLAAQACGYQGKIQEEPDLYSSNPGEYLSALHLLKPEVKLPLVIGHNPILEELIFALTGTSETMPTGAIAHIELAAENWNAVKGNRRHKLICVWRPKELE